MYTSSLASLCSLYIDKRGFVNLAQNSAMQLGSYFVQCAENNICENCTIQRVALYCAVLCVLFYAIKLFAIIGVVVVPFNIGVSFSVFIILPVIITFSVVDSNEIVVSSV